MFDLESISWLYRVGALLFIFLFYFLKIYMESI